MEGKVQKGNEIEEEKLVSPCKQDITMGLGQSRMGKVGGVVERESGGYCVCVCVCLEGGDC